MPGKTSTRHGAQEMSIAVDRLVDTIAGMLLQLPAPQRLEVLRQVEAKIRPTTSKDELIRKLTKVSGAFQVALPARMKQLVGTYKARIESDRLILLRTHGSSIDARIGFYGSVLKLRLPKRIVEALGFPEYVRIRIEDSKIVIEPV